MAFGHPLEFTRRKLIHPVRSVRISSLLIGLLVGTYLLVLVVGLYALQIRIGAVIVLEAGLL